MNNVVFFGAGPYVIPILEVLKKEYNLKLIVTTETTLQDPVSTYAQESGIKLLAVKSLKQDEIEKIKKVNAVVGIVAYFGLILKQEVLDVFPKGILNVHPSLLPKYRGTTPGQTAIKNGDTETGVTIIKLDEKMDHGPILTQQIEHILPIDTSDTLYERLFKIGSQLLSKYIPMFLADSSSLTPQDDSFASYTEKMTRDTGYIDFNNSPDKKTLDYMIRAYYPWPGTWTRLHMADGTWRIVKLLPEKKIQLEGKKPMSYKDFINGYPTLKDFVEKLP